LCCALIKKELESFLAHPHLVVDYISIVEKKSFMETKQVKGNIIILVAVIFYKVRLIDNIYYSSPSI